MGVIKNGVNKIFHKAEKGASSAIRNAVFGFKNVVIGFKVKAILAVVLVLMVLFAAIWFEVSGSLTASASTSVFDTISTSGSASLSGNYEKSGSLVLATNNDVENISSNYIESISKGDLSYAKELLESKITILNTNNSGVYLQSSGGVDPIDLGEDVTLNEHILNTERYNFNRITWGKYIRGVKQEGTPTLTVDSATRLQYPVDSEYDLERFVTMARPYLQSWLIPMSMFSGVATDTTNDNFSNFAYQIISEGYHKITIDQHSLDTKTRVNNYLIYDKTTTQVYIDRTCTIYKYNGSEVEFCNDIEVKGSPVEEKNIRENKSSTDTISTTYNYVLSSVQAFDYSFNSVYNVEKYYEDNNNYNEDTSKADSFTPSEKEYNNKEEIIDKDFVANSKVAPRGLNLASLEVVSESTQRYKYKTITEKEGTEHTDTIVWRDELSYDNAKSTTQKGYTVEQLREYLGADVTLTEEEIDYYESLEEAEELNLIDFLNAKESVYNTYTNNPHSKNIGYNRSYLITSYDVLKNNLSELYAGYSNTIYYGQSIVTEIVSKSTSFYDYSVLAEGSFGWPIDPQVTVRRLSSCTGMRGDVFGGSGTEEHGGDDIPIPEGTALLAARSGKVIINKFNDGGYGWYIVLEHDNGWYTLYGHMCERSNLPVGTEVVAGQVIGRSGNTGRSTGPHLHFEIRYGSPGASYFSLPKLEPMLYIDESTIPQSIYDETDGGVNATNCPDQAVWSSMVKETENTANSINESTSVIKRPNKIENNVNLIN